MNGWFAFPRALFEEWVQSTGPLCELGAIAYLYFYRTFKPRTVKFQRRLVKLEVGQLATTERQLSRDWGWSRDRTANFLKHCQLQGHISATRTANIVVITCLESIDSAISVENTAPNTASIATTEPTKRLPRTGHDRTREQGKPQQQQTEQGRSRASVDVDAGRRVEEWKAQGYVLRGGHRCMKDCKQCEGAVILVGPGHPPIPCRFAIPC